MTYHNPDATMKSCACGRGKIYTGHMSRWNGKVDGKQVCQECVVDHIHEQFLAMRSTK